MRSRRNDLTSKTENTAERTKIWIYKLQHNFRTMATIKRDNIFLTHLIWSVYIFATVWSPHSSHRLNAVKIRIWSDVFFYRRFVNEWLLGEAGDMADMVGSRSKEGEGKCGFDLEFRRKIHQDLFNRCICQAGGDTKSGLHNHILFGCSWEQVYVYIYVTVCVACAWTKLSASKENIKSIFINGVAMISHDC